MKAASILMRKGCKESEKAPARQKASAATGNLCFTFTQTFVEMISQGTGLEFFSFCLEKKTTALIWSSWAIQNSGSTKKPPTYCFLNRKSRKESCIRGPRHHHQHRAVIFFSPVSRQGNVVPADLTAAESSIGHPFPKSLSCMCTFAPQASELCLSWETITLTIQSFCRDAWENTLMSLKMATVLKAAYGIKKYRFLSAPYAPIIRADAKVKIKSWYWSRSSAKHTLKIY